MIPTPTPFRPKQFTGNPDQQSYKSNLALRIYLYRERGYTWSDSEYYARLALRHDIEVPGT